MTDVWGDIYRTEWSGQPADYEFERDDGRVDSFASASNYFGAPRPPITELLARLEGPVLDIAAGAGSHVLYLQSLGLEVIAAEFSPGARDVCRARGCRQVVPIDLRALALAPESFGAIMIMGNTVGAHQTPATFPGLLRTLRTALRTDGRLLFTTIDPLYTTDASHLQYQQRNRDRGQPPGLVKMRVRRQGMHEDWMSLWMLTDAELVAATAIAGLALTDAGEAAARYDAATLRTAEEAREQGRQVRIAELRLRFVDGPVLTMPAGGSGTSDSTGAVGIPGAGTVFFRNFTLSAQWGRLDANGGVLRAADGATLSVPVTGPLDGTSLQGDGWSATLNSGWVVRPAARAGSFAVVRED